MQEEILQDRRQTRIVDRLKKRRNIVVIGLLFILIVLAVLIKYKSEQEMVVLESFLSPAYKLILTPTPTPFPFEELTIPYLRERTYQSTLGELEKTSENQNYTGYLTSYNSDGLRVNGYLTIPKGETPPGGFPAIIFIHGYIPPATYQTLGNYSAYVDFLANNGFVVFKIDLRGHGNSEGEPGGGYYGSDYVVDTLNAYNALQNAEFVNSEKIGLWGHSMAGNIVLRSLAAKPEIPVAVVWAGAVYSYEDWQKYGINDNSYSPPRTSSSSQNQRRRQELFDRYGTPSAKSTFWQQVAPTNFLGDLKSAIQLNHAIDDNVVNIGYSRDLKVLLDKEGVANELNEYTSGGHNISGAPFTSAMQNTVNFFTKYLK